jgi:hypothetical protein
MSVEAVKHIVATIFSAQNALRELAPEFNWSGMGNLLGDYGEYVCLAKYELTKAPSGSSGYDAIDSQGRTVQIKANHSSSTIGFRGDADLLLVIHVESNGEFEEVYFGDFNIVKTASNFSARDNKNTIPVGKLRKMNTAREEK